MTPAILLRIARQVLPWLTEDDCHEVRGATSMPLLVVYSGSERWGDWSAPPSMTREVRAERWAAWHMGALVVSLSCRRDVVVGEA